MKPKHIVMAVGVSSVPNRTKIPGIDDYKGEVIHSADYDNGKHTMEKMFSLRDWNKCT